MADDTRAMFTELIKGKSDDELFAALRAEGEKQGISASPEDFAKQIVDGMVEAFDPEKAAGQSAVVQYDLSSPEGDFSFQIIVKDGKCSASQETNETPRVTLALSFANFLRLISGNLDGMQAFTSGQLKLSGDMMFTQTMQSWFNQ